jgi:hypothetical protein
LAKDWTNKAVWREFIFIAGCRLFFGGSATGGFPIGSSLQVSRRNIRDRKYPRSYCIKVTSQIRSLTSVVGQFAGSAQQGWSLP